MKGGFTKLDSVRAKLIAGTIDFGTAVNKYSDDEASKFTAGMLQAVMEHSSPLISLIKTWW
jgi:peptidyl-prolyl cis-trans isomerase SurA